MKRLQKNVRRVKHAAKKIRDEMASALLDEDAAVRILNHILNEFCSSYPGRYHCGRKEHGGLLTDLTQLQLVDNLIEEAQDQLAYATVLKLKILSEMKR